MCEYTVIRSNRKKVRLELSPDGLVVKAPYEMTDEQIAQIVREKSDWIAEHTAMIKEALQNRAPVEKLTMDEIRELADRAVKVIPERAAYFAPLVGVTYTRITIRNQRTRWGSSGVPSVIQMQAISQVGRAAGVLTQKYGLKDSPERSYVV